MKADRFRLAAMVGAGLAATGLVACAAGTGGPTPEAGADVSVDTEQGSTTTAGTPTITSGTDATTSDGLAAPSRIDLCRWMDWEANELRLSFLQGPPDNSAALPVAASDGYVEGHVRTDTTRLSCTLPVDGVGEYVGHQATTAATVTLVADPDFAFAADVDPPRPFGSEALAFGTHATATSVENGTFTIELADDVYLVLTLLLDGRHNDSNVRTLGELAGTMADAWDAGRVPTFPAEPTDAADVVGICQAALGQERPDAVLAIDGQPILSATGEESRYDGVSTPRVSCGYASEGVSSSEGASLEVDLSLAPSPSDASLAGGQSHDGCVASDGILVTCQPGWVLYATVTGRWLVQTELRDPEAEANLLTQDEVADEALQRAVVDLGDAVTGHVGRIVLTDAPAPGTDPRVVAPAVLSAAPADAECGSGMAIRGVRTERVTATVCQEPDGDAPASIVGTLDGNPFEGAVFAPYPTCAFVVVTGGPAPSVLMCISDGTVEMLVEGDNAEYIGREYLDEAWHLGGEGPDVQGP